MGGGVEELTGLLLPGGRTSCCRHAQRLLGVISVVCRAEVELSLGGSVSVRLVLIGSLGGPPLVVHLLRGVVSERRVGGVGAGVRLTAQGLLSLPWG